MKIISRKCAVMAVSGAVILSVAIGAMISGDNAQAQAATRGTFQDTSGGYGHSLGLTSDGYLYAWGYNQAGQLGNGSNNDIKTPQLVEGLSDVNIVSQDAGLWHSLAVDEDGVVYAWGYNASAQLGLGDTGDRNEPTRVSGLDDVKVVEVSAGTGHSLAVDADGAIYAWGENSSGQLGLGDTERRNIPTQVSALEDVKIVQIYAGEEHSLAVDTDGAIYAWGENSSGQLGLGDTERRNIPTQVSALEDVKIAQISAGSAHSLAVDTDGAIYAWGENSSGQLGLGDMSSRAIPVQIGALDGVKIAQISAGWFHSLAVDANDSVWAWGAGTQGQLGTGSLDCESLPGEIDRSEIIVREPIKDSDPTPSASPSATPSEMPSATPSEMPSESAKSGLTTVPSVSASATPSSLNEMEKIDDGNRLASTGANFSAAPVALVMLLMIGGSVLSMRRARISREEH